MPTLFEIKLNSVRTIENGKTEEGAVGKNLLSAVLIYPRQGIPTLTTLKSLKLKDKELHDYTNGSYGERIFFKETIHTESEIQVSLSAIEKPSKLKKIFIKLLGFGVNAALGASGLSTIAMGVTQSISEKVFEAIQPKDRVTKLGYDKLSIRDDMGTGILTAILKTDKKLTLWVKEDDVLKKKSFPKGFHFATAIFEIKRLEQSSASLDLIASN